MSEGEFSTANPVEALLSQQVRQDPFPFYAAMRAERPVARVEPGFWFVSRYADVHATLTDKSMSVDANRAWRVAEPTPEDELSRFKRQSLTFSDSPDHTRLRRAVTAAFSARAMSELATQLREVVASQWALLAGQDQIDLHADFAEPLPLLAVSLIFGLGPSDVDSLRDWSLELRSSGDLFEHQQLQAILAGSRTPHPNGLQREVDQENREEGIRVVRAFSDFCLEIIAARRANPTSDILGVMANPTDPSRTLGDNELVSLMMNLLMGGHIGTTNTIGNALVALLDNPEELAHLRTDPSLSESATEEGFRFGGANQLTRRIVTRDTDLDGHLLLAGEVVVPMVASANHDESVYADPERFDITRQSPRPNLATGAGEHFCIGTALGKTLCRMSIEQLLQYDVTPSWDSPNELKVRPSLTSRGYEEIPANVVAIP